MAEITLFETDDALLYGVTPESIVEYPEQNTTKYYKKYWRTPNVLWKGKLQVVKIIPIYENDDDEEVEDKCQVRLKNSGNDSLVGVAPYDADGNGVQLTADSIRYSVLTLESNGFKFKVGITFEDLGNASLFTDALRQFRKEAYRPEKQPSNLAIKDYSLKDGETIHLDSKKHAEVVAAADNEHAQIKPLNPPPLLPPPSILPLENLGKENNTESDQKKEGKLEQAEEDDEDDDFGDFVS